MGTLTGRAREGLLGSPSSSSAGAERGATQGGTGRHHHEHQQHHHPDTMQVVQELGLKGLYTGSALTLARDVPSTALFLRPTRTSLQPEQQERLLAAFSCLSPLVYVFLAACVSSIPASVLVTPSTLSDENAGVCQNPGLCERLSQCVLLKGSRQLAASSDNLAGHLCILEMDHRPLACSISAFGRLLVPDLLEPDSLVPVPVCAFRAADSTFQRHRPRPDSNGSCAEAGFGGGTHGAVQRGNGHAPWRRPAAGDHAHDVRLAVQELVTSDSDWESARECKKQRHQGRQVWQ